MQELGKLIIKYHDDKEEYILDDYMVFRFLASDYESLQSMLDIYAYDDNTENCVVLTEMAFPSIVTSMLIQERGLEESKKAQEMVYIKSSMNTIYTQHR